MFTKDYYTLSTNFMAFDSIILANYLSENKLSTELIHNLEICVSTIKYALNELSFEELLSILVGEKNYISDCQKRMEEQK